MENIAAAVPNANMSVADDSKELPVEQSPSDSNTITPPVLTEKNKENKMISPVLFNLRKGEKRVTPPNPVDPVKVPPKKFFGFPAERYMSPTDSVMSPISRGLLARSRRAMKPHPAFVPPKVLDNTFQDAEPANPSAPSSKIKDSRLGVGMNNWTKPDAI